MKKTDMKNQILLLATGLVLIAGGFQTTTAQELRWIRVGQTQTWFMDYGTECEGTNFLAWPAQYGDDQTTTRQKGVWIGARNFYDPVEKKDKSVKVVGAGPRYDSANQLTMVFPQSIKLIGRSNPPAVVVDNQTGTNNTLYDVLDDQKDDLPCDRMVVIQFNTSIGVSVTKKVMGFTQQNHDNYFIHDYVFKNTGIYSKTGDVYNQTLKEFWVYFVYRYAFAGVTSLVYGSTWGSFGSQWGETTLFHTFGESPDAEMRGFYAYYGPTKSYSHPLKFEEDWGCPNYEKDGLLGSAKYSGTVTLFASKSAQDWSDDPSQPRTTSYLSSDDQSMQASVSQFDEIFMELRYKWMTEGHLAQPLDEFVGDRYQSDVYSENPRVSNSSQGQGFGPYELAPGDSIHIVFAEGVSGLSWPQCRVIGANWYTYYKGIGTPDLIMPDGSTKATDANVYKRAWCETGVDSIMQTYRNAAANFKSGYKIPQPPPAPEVFEVASGGDRIRLTWASNADNAPHFDGYVIYRSEGNVKDYRTVFTKIFECNKANAVHQYDDLTAVRGFNYYYSIQSKDDGTQNDLRPGTPLLSSLFLTQTSVAAYLRRPAGNILDEVRVVPNPYDIRARAWQFGDESQYDRIAFYGLPPLCKLKIFTENGVLIWEKDHTNGAGDEIWDSMTSSGQIVVSGVYILYVEVTEDYSAPSDMVATHDIYDDNKKLMFGKDELMFHQGDQIFRKGESKYRKFVVIR